MHQSKTRTLPNQSKKKNNRTARQQRRRRREGTSVSNLTQLRTGTVPGVGKKSSRQSSGR